MEVHLSRYEKRGISQLREYALLGVRGRLNCPSICEEPGQCWKWIVDLHRSSRHSLTSNCDQWCKWQLARIDVLHPAELNDVMYFVSLRRLSEMIIVR